MATSGTFAEHSTNLAIVAAALRKINRLGDFETLADSDVRYTAALVTLKHIVKEMAIMGMPLWAIDELEIPLSNAGFGDANGVTIGTAGADVTATPPLKIIQCLRRDADDNDYEMEVYTQDRYNQIPNKTETGAPLAYTFYPNDASVVATVKSTLKVWPLPDTTWATDGSLYIRYQRPFEDVGTSAQNLDFPAEWQRAIVYTLAYDLAPDYGVDVNLRTALKRDRDELLARAESFMTEEGSLFIQPVRKR
jgi:hypothetical protein